MINAHRRGWLLALCWVLGLAHANVDSDDWYPWVAERAQATVAAQQPLGHEHWLAYRQRLAMPNWQLTDALPLMAGQGRVTVLDWLTWEWLQLPNRTADDWPAFVQQLQQQQQRPLLNTWLGSGRRWSRGFHYHPHEELLVYYRDQELQIWRQQQRLLFEPDVMDHALHRSALQPQLLGVWLLKRGQCDQGLDLAFRLLDGQTQILEACSTIKALLPTNKGLWAYTEDGLRDLFGVTTWPLSDLPSAPPLALFWLPYMLWLSQTEPGRVRLHRQPGLESAIELGAAYGFWVVDEQLFFLQQRGDQQWLWRYDNERFQRWTQPLPDAVALESTAQGLGYVSLFGEQQALPEGEWLNAEPTTSVHLAPSPLVGQQPVQFRANGLPSYSRLGSDQGQWFAAWQQSGFGLFVSEATLSLAQQQGAWQWLVSHEFQATNPWLFAGQAELQPLPGWSWEQWLSVGETASTSSLLYHRQQQTLGDGGFIRVPVKQARQVYGHWQSAGQQLGWRLGVDQSWQWQVHNRQWALALGGHWGELPGDAHQSLEWRRWQGQHTLWHGAWANLHHPWVVNGALRLDVASDLLPFVQPYFTRLGMLPWQFHWQGVVNVEQAEDLRRTWLQQQISVDTGDILGIHQRWALGWRLHVQAAESSWYLQWQQGF